MIVSIVGTRKLSLKGQRRTREWSMELAKRGYIIVSGMALGTDTIAHEACIAENGYTVAVLAGPVDRPYPASNVRLYNKICDSGLVVSEVFPKTPVVPGMFASRNRITAGLSKATIVIEAPIKSGSLITAKSAFDYDRYVFAVPGNDPCYAGCNLLIKENVAALSDSISDITSQLENSTS
jgi:DNA processing protein